MTVISVVKLLILTNDFPNESDTYISNIFIKDQVKALAKMVEAINVIVPIPRGLEKKRRILYEDYLIRENVNVFFVRYSNPLFPITYRKLRKQWIAVEAKAITKFIKRHQMKFDVIHAHYTWPSGAVAVKLKEEFNCPVIITEHTSLTLKKAVENKDGVYLNTWKLADAVIRVRRGDMNDIKKLGVQSDKLYYIPNGFDGEKFKPMSKEFAKQKLNLNTTRTILSIGALLPIKGHKYLIEAMQRVIKEFSDVTTFIIGDGPLKGVLEKQTKKLSLNHHVKLVGAKPHHEIPLWMNAADIFVLPSLSEGNPTVMFEALGIGLPFVGTKVGGVPEIIASDEFGFLVEPANSRDLSNKILFALEKRWNREVIRNYGRQFSWDNIALQIINLYQKTLKA